MSRIPDPEIQYNGETIFMQGCHVRVNIGQGLGWEDGNCRGLRRRGLDHAESVARRVVRVLDHRAFLISSPDQSLERVVGITGRACIEEVVFARAGHGPKRITPEGRHLCMRQGRYSDQSEKINQTNPW
jgi:hypothetical protein